MGFRFRIGPFTFGRTGTRLSLWGCDLGLSVPITGKGGTSGKISLGPISWYPSSSRTDPPATQDPEVPGDPRSQSLASLEEEAIAALTSDRQFLERLRQFGVPWRGVQERLKQELPPSVGDRDRTAYALVPKAMNAVFGQQEHGWTTEKRPSKSGTGETAWIKVVA